MDIPERREQSLIVATEGDRVLLGFEVIEVAVCERAAQQGREDSLWDGESHRPSFVGGGERTQSRGKRRGPWETAGSLGEIQSLSAEAPADGRPM